MRPLARVTVLAALASAGVADVGLAQVEADPQALWSDLRIPGTASGFAMAAGLNETLDPQRLVLEWVRVRHLPLPTGQMRLGRMRTYLETLMRFGPEVTLPGEVEGLRKHSQHLELLGLSLVRQNRIMRVVPSRDRGALETRALLMQAGLQLEGLDDRLNAGQSVRVQLPSFTTLLPMSADFWLRVVFGGNSPRSSAITDSAQNALYYQILNGDTASLLYYGLASAHPSLRAYLTTVPRFASWIYRNHADVFALCAGSLRIREGRIDVPGSDEATGSWEALVNENTSDPEQFIRRLLDQDSGRLGFFYTVMDSLDSPRRRFALGLNEGLSEGAKWSRTRSMYELWFTASSPAWTLDKGPFFRPEIDPFVLLSQIAVDDSGRPSGPMWRYLWREVFAGASLPGRPERELSRGADAVDALFLIRSVFESGPDDPPKDRLRAFLFAQRVFAVSQETAAPDLLVALRGFRRFPMLHLSLERAGIHQADIHASAARRAEKLSAIENADIALASISQFQGALAIIERARFTNSLNPSDAATLVRSLLSIEVGRDGSYGARMAQWLDRQLFPTIAGVPRIEDVDAMERVVLSAVAGFEAGRSPGTPSAPGVVVEWEGLQYRVNIASALFRRMLRVRERQAGNSIGTVLALARVSEVLTGTPTLTDVTTQLGLLARFQKELNEPRPPERLTDLELISLRQGLRESGRELARITTEGQLRNAKSTATFWLEPVVALLTADLLRALTYALYVSDPDTPLLADGDVSHTHDLGLRLLARRERERTAWGFPRQLGGGGDGRRVSGALLGLDIALADVVLRRVVSGDTPAVSLWSPENLTSFAHVVALFNPFDVTLADSSRVDEGIKRGRAVVARLASNAPELEDVLSQARLGPVRQSLVRRALQTDPGSVHRMFSLLDLLRLGGDEGALALAVAWGAPAVELSGCLCVALPPPVDWEVFGGRHEQPFLASGSADLLLRLAEIVSELKLPATIVGDILPLGTRAVMDRSRPSHPDDWIAIMQTASSLSRNEVEDYVSRVAATGGSMIPLSAN
jgi:hypothetical protein